MTTPLMMSNTRSLYASRKTHISRFQNTVSIRSARPTKNDGNLCSFSTLLSRTPAPPLQQAQQHHVPCLRIRRVYPHQQQNGYFMNSNRFLSSSSSALYNDADKGSINISPTQTSLALSVHFKHPDLGMRDYEILSRATAFLVNVDPPTPEGDEFETKSGKQNNNATTSTSSTTTHNSQGFVHKSAYPHLAENRSLREKLLHKQQYAYEPASGPRRFPHQLNWLEFCPNAFRPKVHVMASSHVLSPWLWPKYYGQDWLRLVNEEHVRYSLEVWGSGDGGNKRGNKDANDKEEYNNVIGHDGKLVGSYKPLAKFALNPFPIHHPQDMDIAVIHLKQEDTALKHLMGLGIQPLNLPTMHNLQSSNDPVFLPDERVLFQGFEVYESNMADQETVSSDGKKTKQDKDERLFHPYSSLGNLTMASPDRFLAQTKGGPLPEGLCGGPVIQITDLATGTDIATTANRRNAPLNLRGVVEGIVPITHEDPKLAGSASFLPSYRIREFVDFAERVMLEQIIPEDLFQRVVELKDKRTAKDTVYRGGVGHELNIEEEDASLNSNRNRRAKDCDDDDDVPSNPYVEGTGDSDDTPELDREYQEILASLHEKHTPEEVDAILATIEAERKEVIQIIEKDGGDIDDVIAEVRKRTYEKKDKILEEIQMEMEKDMWGKTNIQEGEIVSTEKDKKS